MLQIGLINLNELKTITTQKSQKNLPKLLSEKEILNLIDKAREIYTENPIKNIKYLRIQLILRFYIQLALELVNY